MAVCGECFVLKVIFFIPKGFLMVSFLPDSFSSKLWNLFLKSVVKDFKVCCKDV